VVKEAGEVVPAAEHVIRWLQDFGGAREGCALTQRLGVHLVDEWFALLLAHGNAIAETGLPFWFWCGFLDVSQFEEAPPRMSEAKCRRDRQHLLLRLEQRLEAIVAVGLQDAGEPRQMPLRVLALSVARCVIDRCRPRGSSEGTVIAYIGPDPPGRALAPCQDAEALWRSLSGLKGQEKRSKMCCGRVNDAARSSLPNDIETLKARVLAMPRKRPAPMIWRVNSPISRPATPTPIRASSG